MFRCLEKLDICRPKCHWNSLGEAFLVKPKFDERPASYFILKITWNIECRMQRRVSRPYQYVISKQHLQYETRRVSGIW
jgi:hypothetical protein